MILAANIFSLYLQLYTVCTGGSSNYLSMLCENIFGLMMIWSGVFALLIKCGIYLDVELIDLDMVMSLVMRPEKKKSSQESPWRLVREKKSLV